MRSDEPFDPQTRLLTSDGSQWLVRRPDPGIRSLVVVLLLLLAAALAQAGTELGSAVLDFHLSSLDMTWFSQGLPFSLLFGFRGQIPR